MIKQYAASTYAPVYLEKIWASAFPMGLIQSLETKFGKPFIAFDIPECQEYIKLNMSNKKTSNEATAQKSLVMYCNIRKVYKKMWEWYIDNVEVVRNPWTNDIFSEKKAYEWAFSEQKIDLNTYQRAIEVISNNYDGDYAIYLECVCTLFYEGFSNPKEVPLLKKSDIDFQIRTIKIEDRVIHVSERLLHLLKKVHDMDGFDHYHTRSDCVTWHGSYFKFIAQHGSVVENENLARVAKRVTDAMKNVRSNADFEISVRILYMTGFVNFAIQKTGSRESAKEVILETKNNKQFVELLNEYGFKTKTISSLRKQFYRYL